MQDIQIRKFRSLLEKALEELLSPSDAANDAAKPVALDQSSVGRLSRMDAMQGQAMAIETRRRRELQLRRVQLALARIAAGEFGVCLSCEENIDPRRLEADPTATLCITCAAKQEA